MLENETTHTFILTVDTKTVRNPSMEVLAEVAYLTGAFLPEEMTKRKDGLYFKTSEKR